ncbi:hypothetical protein CYY_007726 [Polysphondylium violaceum]|uniref:Leucine-rich repeat-containing protein n=1 Tax=Polysphondylium violaceum TaxID=133409 RepID=A0A8J4PNX0_9MYCE|nr:hypothetical protein CYY_007726 [Polysphondylium violaceum]
MNSNNIISTNKVSNNIDPTFLINNLPTTLVRKIVSSYYNHYYMMYKHAIDQRILIDDYSFENNGSGQLAYIWINLNLICKYWTTKVVPYLSNNFYFINSKNKLESYLKFVEYGVSFPRRFMPDRFGKAVKQPAHLVKAPVEITNLEIFIDQRQIKSYPDAIIPPQVYDMILQTKGLSKFKFLHSAYKTTMDLYYVLQSLSDPSRSFITHLDISGNVAGNKEFAALHNFIMTSKTLESLNMSSLKIYTDIQPVAADKSLVYALRNCKTLQKVYVNDRDGRYDNFVGGATEFVYWALKESNLRVFHYISNATLDSFEQLRPSYSSSDTDPEIQDQQFYTIQPHLRELKMVLRVHHNNPFMAYLGTVFNNNGFDHLVHLDISKTVFEVEPTSIKILDGISFIKGLQELNLSGATFSFEDSPFADRFDFIGRITQLSTLNLSNIGLNNEKASKLLAMLETNHVRTLTALDISKNNLSIQCLTALTSLIKHPESKLAKLNLCRNAFGGYMNILLLSFQLSHSLTDINLSFNNFTDREGVQLCKYLEKNTTLRDLNIAGNHFQLLTPNYLQYALLANTTLVSLNFSNIHLDSIGIAYVFEGISERSNLSLLVLKDVLERGSKGPAGNLITSFIKTCGLKCIVIDD